MAFAWLLHRSGHCGPVRLALSGMGKGLRAGACKHRLVLILSFKGLSEHPCSPCVSSLQAEAGECPGPLPLECSPAVCHLKWLW